MNTDHVAISITVVAFLALTVLGWLFLLLVLAGRMLTRDYDRTRLGNALGQLSGATGILMLSFAGFMAMRLYVGPSPAPLEPSWLYTAFRTTLAASALWCLVAGVMVLPKLIQRFRNRPGDVYEINQAAVFGTLAQALPIIVSNHEGTIQHTTTGFDTLVGGLPGDLIGKSLEEIMPERYHAGHHHGMTRYVETREPHIIGTVVAIDMLRRDGVEIPVYLALNTTDVDGKPWFVASIWPKPRVEPETPASPLGDNVVETIEKTSEDVEEVKVDVKILKRHADASDVRADAAEARADAAETRADAAETDPHGSP